MDINNIVNSTRIRNARLLDDINNKILNREYYKFKYLPIEGALPGLYFQQQTEDAINDIGNVAYATEQVADEALKIAQQAYNIALAALETANNALAAAQTAQQTADTALNIANNALSVGTAAATAAAAAQNRADEAYDLADAAQKAADAAQNTADSAQKAANSAANDATNALTKAEDALTKIEQLSVLNYYNNVTEATDVNTLVDIHRWYLQASNNPNAPETNPGFINVDNDYNDSVCKQLWVSETTGAIYNRFGQIVENSDPATVSSWSEWYKLATNWQQSGGLMTYKTTLQYSANCLVNHNNKLYMCILANGVDTAAGLKTPGVDTTYWQELLPYIGGITPEQVQDKIDVSIGEIPKPVATHFGSYSIVSSSGTATTDGIITAKSYSNTKITGYVNGLEVMYTAGRSKYGQGSCSISFPVPKGATYLVSSAEYVCWLPLISD